MLRQTYAIFRCRSSLQCYFFKSYLKPMTKHWLETSRPSSTALGPIHRNPGIFWNCILFFVTNKPFFVHTKQVNPPSETISCSVKTLAVHTNQGKKICGFKNVRTRVNMASVTANCEKQWRNSMERAFY